MEKVVSAIIQQYGLYGLILILMGFLGYLIWGDRKNNWGSKIDKLCGKFDNMDAKLELVKDKLSIRIDNLENKVQNMHITSKVSETNEARNHTMNVINGQGGKLSKILKYYCKKANCDHIALGSFHNGTTDLRGLHYCKFDVLVDEFRDPLHIPNLDTDFQPLYKDENIIAYGDLPYKMTHVDAAIFDLKTEDGKQSLLDLSDTIYRRCEGRGIKSVGFVCLRDNDGFPVGFIGCINFDDKQISKDDLCACAREIENIYNSDDE